MDAERNGFAEQIEYTINTIPQDNDVTSEIIIVDERCCIREAIASSIRGDGQRKIITTESTADFTATAFCGNNSARQLILLCDGQLSSESLDGEISRLRKYNPVANLALLTDQQPGEMVDFLQSNYSVSIIPSHYSTAQLLACIQVIESGIDYLPAEFIQISGCQISENSRENSNELSTVLTPRQREVMEYIVKGRSNKYIAAELSVSESTIKVHVHDAMRRLGATSRTHASYLLKFCGDISPNPSL